MAFKTEWEMLADFKRHNDLNAKEGHPYRVLPLRPTIGMMQAALDAPNVFREGDKASDWLEPLDRLATPDERFIHAGLVGRFGEERAFALSLAADIWVGCIAGLREWITIRGRMGGGTPFSDGWFKPIPKSCPPGGWPMGKDQVTPVHEAHAKCGETPIRLSARGHWLAGWDSGYDEMPLEATAIMAMRGAQSHLNSTQYLLFDDAVDFRQMPYVPGWAPTGRHDDEERHHLLAGAMWAAAAGAFDAGTTGEPMPEHPVAQAIRVTRIIHDETPSRLVGHQDLPFASVAIESGTGRFSYRLEEGTVSWEAEIGNRGVSERGLVLCGRCGETRTMRKMLRDVAHGEGAGASFTLVQRNGATAPA